MDTRETIIIGGGPSGSSCAGRLAAAGHDVMVIDRAVFPREKLCAGWVTGQALRALGVRAEEYPRGIQKLRIRTHIPYVPTLPFGPIAGENWSVRRVEFDDWLLTRSGAPVVQHKVREIVREGEWFVIDGQWRARNLVGAGGTSCPVRRALFPEPRVRHRQIVTLEREFDYPARPDTCHLFFFYRKLRGYAWYVPKMGGGVNIGIGGKASWFRRQDETIHDHLRWFLGDLQRMGLLDAQTVAGFKAGGHPYYLAGGRGPVRDDGVWLVGDSAGLSSVDLGEGIGPAIESGVRVAAEILGGEAYAPGAIDRYSTRGPVRAAARLALGKGARG